MPRLWDCAWGGVCFLPDLEDQRAEEAKTAVLKRRDRFRRTAN